MKLVIMLLSLFMALILFAASLPYLPEIKQSYIFVIILSGALCMLSYGIGRHFNNSVIIGLFTPTIAGLLIMYKLHQIDVNDKLGMNFISFLSFAFGICSLWFYMQGAAKPTIIDEKKIHSLPKDGSS